MRDWHLTQSDPYTLRLAADARLGPTDYADDQIWEMALSGSDPAALTLRTTYGLRARDMRLFFGFAEGEQVVFNPAEFATPPEIRAFFVNYFRLTFCPLPDLAVTAEYWCPDSHIVAGRLSLTNTAAAPRQVRVLLSAILKPLDNPKVLAPIKLDEFAALEGHTGNLDVTVAFDGAAGAEPLTTPTLARSMALAPNETVSVRWMEVALAAPAATPLAPDVITPILRNLFTREWDAEFARIELINAGLLEVETGDQDWNTAFAFAQTVALSCYVGPTKHLPHPSFIFTRGPDKGYSRKGDGSDHAWQWDGQVATEAYVNLPQIVTVAPELAKGVIRNWLAVQDAKGFIDWKPGLGGQRNKALCIPLLAAMAWQIYEHIRDREFLAEVYPGLRRFVEVWFTGRYDRDEDGVPEWSHTIQSAFDDNPSFVRWQTWGQGADSTQAEAPDLAAYLYRECVTLQRIAALLEQPADEALAQRIEKLRQAVDKMWHAETNSYHYVDRDSHECTAGRELARGRGNLTVELSHLFVPSARLIVRAIGPKDARPEMEVILTGRGRRGRHRVETLKRSHIQWYFGIGSATSDKLYRELERVEVRGLTEEVEVSVAVVDYTRQDQTLLLPLWGGLPDAARAELLVRKTLTDPERYWRPFGIPNCSAQDPAYKPDNREGSGGVWLMWNTMLGEGLVEYGYRAEAAELIKRMMTAMVYTLKEEKAFREAYHCDKLEGLGERNYLWGVAPLALFLRVLGVRVISPRQVYLEGRSPFPWPVTIRHKGLTVTKDASGAQVTFPSGKVVRVEGEAGQLVEEG